MRIIAKSAIMMMVPLVNPDCFPPRPDRRFPAGAAARFFREGAVRQGIVELELDLLFRFRELAVYARGDQGQDVGGIVLARAALDVDDLARRRLDLVLLAEVQLVDEIIRPVRLTAG